MYFTAGQTYYLSTRKEAQASTRKLHTKSKTYPLVFNNSFITLRADPATPKPMINGWVDIDI